MRRAPALLLPLAAAHAGLAAAAAVRTPPVCGTHRAGWARARVVGHYAALRDAVLAGRATDETVLAAGRVCDRIVDRANLPPPEGGGESAAELGIA
eukprot:gene50469-19289_t